MKIEQFKHENVREDGVKLVNGEPYGSVHTKKTTPNGK